MSTSEDGRVACVLDGRLLNAAELTRALEGRGFRLRTAEHAEIVANLFQLHGEDAFAQLDGPFAVALAAEDKLVLARDALGEKPLYYTDRTASAPSALLFASEIKAFLAHPRFSCEPDLDALNRLLVFSFIPGRDTMFRGVYELEPGHYLRVGPDGAPGRAVKYWDVEERIEDDKDEAHFVERTEALTRAAVAKRIPAAAGRFGAFLSGGIDSSAVVALLAAQGLSPITFSVAFGEGQPNEIAYARMVAEHVGVEHRVLHVEPDQFLDVLPRIIWSLDDPLCDCITVPNYLLAQEASREVGVVWNGEGGDPLFGGPKNKFLILGEWYAFLGAHDRARAYLGSYHKFYDHLEDACTPELLARTGGAAPLLDLVRPYLEDERIKSLLNRLMRVNIKLKGGQNILVKVDKMLSAHGIEAASPLFDRELADFSFAIPPRYKRRGDVEKYVFKKAVEGLLPRPVVYRKKAGMGVPLNHWFRKTSLRGYAADLLTSARAAQRGYFRRDFVERLLSGRSPASAIGQDRSGELLWMLVAIELWHRVFVDGEGRP